MTLSIALSAVAVVVSVATFYLTRVRPGSLEMVGNPPSYGTTFEPSGLLRLRLPITINNPGARTAVVPILKLLVPPELGGGEAFAHYRCESVKPSKDRDNRTGVTFVQPVPVEGGATEVIIGEFHLNNVSPEKLRADNYHFRLETLQRQRRSDAEASQWHELGDVWLYVTEHERAGFGNPEAHFNGLR